MKKLVLVVEDDNPIQHLLKDILEEAAYAVQTVRLGKEVVSKARATSPDLILLDLMLPDLDGNDVLALLNGDARLSRIPVIVLSAYPQLLKKSPQVQAIIAKPFDIVELLDEIEEHIKTGYGVWSAGLEEGDIQTNTPSVWTG